MAPQFSERDAVSSFASFLVSVNTMERPAQPCDLIMSATMVLRCVQWHGSTRCLTLVEACRRSKKLQLCASGDGLEKHTLSM